MSTFVQRKGIRSGMKKIQKNRLSIAILLFGLLLTFLVKGVGSIVGSMNKDIPLADIQHEAPIEKTYYDNFGISVPNNYSIHGIDVSKHQSDINWEQVEEMRVKGVRLSFVFIKASEGASQTDINFQRNWNALDNTRLLRGAYHFFRPVKDPRVQAELFISQVRLKKGDLPPVVDIEHENRQSTQVIRQRLQTFLTILEKEYHCKPIIYSNLSFYTRHLAGKFGKYPVWIAYYLDDPFMLPDNRKWSFWQYSESGNVNGIRGKVDFNVFHGNLGQLRALCKK